MLRAIPGTLMRGGTSKALYFHARDLPPVGARRATRCCSPPWARPIRARSMAWAARIR